MLSSRPKQRFSSAKSVPYVPPWVDCIKDLTRKIKRIGVTLVLEMTVKRARKILYSNDSRIWRILLADMNENHAEFRIDNVLWLWVDQMALRDGQKYLLRFAYFPAENMPLA